MSDFASTNALQGPALAPIARRVLVVQLALTLLITIILFSLSGVSAGLSALLGAASAILPNLAFLTMLWYSREISSQEFMARFRRGEAAKFLLTICIFGLILIIHFPDLRPLPLFIGFGVVLLGHWIGLLTGIKPEPRHGT